jgi:transcription initiation factor IIE alpha subunit
MPFEVAAEYNFVCPACGSQMSNANDPKRQKELDDKIKKLKAEMGLLAKI